MAPTQNSSSFPLLLGGLTSHKKGAYTSLGNEDELFGWNGDDEDVEQHRELHKSNHTHNRKRTWFSKATSFLKPTCNASQKAVAAFQEGSYSRAIQACNEALHAHHQKRDSAMAETFALRGHAKARTGDHPGAVADFTEALMIRPTCRSALHGMGVSVVRLGDFTRAISYYTRLLSIDPNNAQVLNLRGIAKYSIGKAADADERRQWLQDSVQDYTAALAIDQEHPESLNNRAVARIELGEHADAVADCTGALRQQPKFVAALNNRGLGHYGLCNYQAAIEDWTAVLELNQRDPSVYSNRGHAKKRLGDHEGAVADFAAALQQELQADAAMHDGKETAATQRLRRQLQEALVKVE
jgi:tetratricopeptide (TPR) repeat protein